MTKSFHLILCYNPLDLPMLSFSMLPKGNRCRDDNINLDITNVSSL